MPITDLPLHRGKAPKWLFGRMVKLSGRILRLMVDEWGTEGVLKRLANPFWFQSLACFLGFDWHSSGTTTTTTAALAISMDKLDLGLKGVGGKGKRGLEVRSILESRGLQHLADISRLVAKSDSSLVQDGFSLYHHTLFYDNDGNWTVIQQGLWDKWARRYQWFNEVHFGEPHRPVISNKIKDRVLNLSSPKSSTHKKSVVEMVQDGDYLRLPTHHHIRLTKRSQRILMALEPESFDDIWMHQGIGPRTLRALSMAASIIYGEEPDWRDPALFAYAHGGKDGIPFPVDTQTYDETISFLERCAKDFNLQTQFKRWKRALNPGPSFIHRQVSINR